TLSIFLLTISVYFIDTLRDKPSTRNFILTGVLLGLAALARPNIIIFIPFFLGWMFFFQKTRTLRITLFLSGLLIVILPVTIRNYAVSGDLVLISSQGGVAFYMGNNAESTGFTGWVPGTSRDWWGEGKTQTDQIAEKESGESLQPSQISSYWFGRGFAEMSAKPGKWLQLFGKKIKYLFSGYEISDTEDIYYERKSSVLLSMLLWNGWLKFPYGLLVPLALFGFLLCFRWAQESHLLLFQLAYALSIVLYFVTARYRLPLVPIFAVWSAAGVNAALLQVKAKSFNKLIIPGIALLAGLVLLNLNPGIKKTGDHLEAVIALGTKYLDQGEHEKALASFQQALDLDSTAVRAANSAGVAAINSGRTAAAMSYFEQALRHDPYLKNARLNLARLQHGAGQLDQAVANLQIALQIDTTFGAAYAELGDIFFDTEKYPPAIELYELADQYGASDLKLLNRWAKALFIEKQIPAAIAVNQRLVKADPQNPMAHYNQGLFYLAADSLSQAEASFKRVLELDPGNNAAQKRLRAIQSLK
ncbi:tetratricopeptide repeat protein, partial [bacterium]|nr:tetratricopeptide repeat protein [bacterium]